MTGVAAERTGVHDVLLGLGLDEEPSRATEAVGGEPGKRDTLGQPPTAEEVLVRPHQPSARSGDNSSATSVTSPAPMSSTRSPGRASAATTAARSTLRAT